MVEIRRFQDADAEQVSSLIKRDFLEVNIQDYPAEEMRQLVLAYTAPKLMQLAREIHLYVACISGEAVGCGGISSFKDREGESMLRSVFVNPQYHGLGIGRMIVKALEGDEYSRRAKRIEVPSSITACGFYEKLGYQYKDGKKEKDEQGLFRMEKFW